MYGVYVGERTELLGERADLVQETSDTVGAQFDNLSLSHDLTHGRTSFPESDFDIDPPVDWGD